MAEELAFQSDELDLSETEQASARHLYLTAGAPTVEECIETLRKNGRDSAVLECALLLPLEEYRRVEEVYNEVDPPARRATRRRS